MKNAIPNQQRVNLHYNIKKLYEHRPSIAWFLSGFMTIREIARASIFSFHVDIPGNSLLELYFLLPHLTGTGYHYVLWNVLPKLLQDVHLQTIVHLWFKHEGAPPHFLFSFQKFLNMFPEQSTGQHGPTAWLAHSPDLNPLDFYLWRHTNSNV